MTPRPGLSHIVIMGLLVVGCATQSAVGFDTIAQADVENLRRSGRATGNLQVQIDIEADAERDNARDASDFETEFEVRVRRDGTTVRDATVTVQAYEGPTLTLRYDDGKYEGEVRGYHRAYRVDVRAGDDRVEGIYLTGPAIHHFTAPAHRQTVPAGQPLEVRWQAADRADMAWIEGDDFDRVRIDDTGRYTIAASRLDDDDDEIELRRANVMPIEGAAQGSAMRIVVKNEVDVRIRDR